MSIPVPPDEYLKDCPIPYLEKTAPTNRDLTDLAVAREYALKHCNVDKAALRAWYDGMLKACGLRCRAKN